MYLIYTMNEETDQSFDDPELLPEATDDREYRINSSQEFRVAAKQFSEKMEAESSKLQKLSAAIQAKIKQLKDYKN